MQLTGKQAMAAQAALRALASKPVKVTGAVKIAKALQDLATVTGVIEERRRALLDGYALKSEDGKLVVDASGNATFDGATERDAFAAAYNALIGEAIDLELQPVSVRELGEVEIAPDAVGPLVAVGLVV